MLMLLTRHCAALKLDQVAQSLGTEVTSHGKKEGQGQRKTECATSRLSVQFRYFIHYLNGLVKVCRLIRENNSIVTRYLTACKVMRYLLNISYIN
jgi:hypothetical protein